MKQKIQGNNSILQNNQQILFTMEESSDMIKYHSFGILPVKSTIWMQETKKYFPHGSTSISAI